MFRGIIAAFVVTGFSIVGCAVESGEPEPGEETSTAEQAAGGCQEKCQKCPPNKFCTMECKLIGNCGSSCTMIALCVEGYVWSDTACQCLPDNG
jgi:hypothetical protein